MEENNKFVEAVARLTNVQMSARKMRLVVDIIRGENVEKAFNILRYTKKEAASWLEKLLASAVANWKVLSEEEPDEYELVVKKIWVDQSAQLKRFRPAPHGRAHRIRKHFCHVNIVLVNTVELEEEEEEDVEIAEVLEGNE